MFAPRVFVSMIGALCIFALATFWLTGSAWTTAWQTLLCAVLLQLGYFIGILILVSKAARERRRLAADRHGGPPVPDEKPAATPVSNLDRPGHFNS